MILLLWFYLVSQAGGVNEFYISIIFVSFHFVAEVLYGIVVSNARGRNQLGLCAQSADQIVLIANKNKILSKIVEIVLSAFVCLFV